MREHHDNYDGPRITDFDECDDDLLDFKCDTVLNMTLLRPYPETAEEQY